MGSEASRVDRDTVVGLVGAVVLIAAMAGVFFYERAQFDEYTVSWSTTEAASFEEAGSALNAGASAEHAFTVDPDPVARVRVVIQWTDDVGNPDRFRVDVAGPDGLEGSADGESGEFEVVVPVSEAPSTTTAPGRSAEDAEAQAALGASTDAGQGDWTVTVTLLSAPGQPVAGGVESQADGSNDYALTFVVEAWDATVEPGPE